MVQRDDGEIRPLNITPEKTYVRTYRLQGAAAFTWDSRELEAECRNYHAPSQGFSEDQYLDPKERLEKHLTHGQHLCGIHITKTPAPGAGVSFDGYPVIAWVTGWGSYIEYDAGWRVQHARIEWLKVHDASRDADKLRDELARVYSVPVEITGGYQPCCFREHTSHLYKTSDREEVSICKVPTSDLLHIFDVTKLMGFNSYSQRAMNELLKELAERREVHYDVFTRQWMLTNGSVILSEIDMMR